MEIEKNCTFLSWEKEAVIGHKTINENGKMYVNFIWCKVCAKNKNKLSVKGAAVNSLKAFTDGTSVVTNHQVDRHLLGETHRIALSYENMATNMQVADEYLKDSAEDAYMKLMGTAYEMAYEMALHPAMAHKHFGVLVKCQRINGVKLVKGKDNHKACLSLFSCTQGFVL